MTTMKLSKTSRRFLTLLLALVMCMSVGITASAAEMPQGTPNVEAQAVASAEDSGIMPLSSVSGYARKTLTKGNNMILVECDGEGIGGMGVTIRATSSSGGSVSFSGASYGSYSGASDISGSVVLNGPDKEFHGLWHNQLAYYAIVFDIPDGVSIDVQVWIYG